MSRSKPVFSAEYRRSWLASTISNLGDGMRMTSLPLLATTLTTHPLSISLVPALGGLPWLLFSPFAGAIIDRHDRRHLMLLTFALCAVLLALIHTPLQAQRTRATTGILADVRSGFVALWASPGLRRLAPAGGAFNLCLSGAYAVFVLLISDAHSGGSAIYGLMLAIGAIGGLVGAMTAGPAAQAIGRGRALVLAMSLAGAGLVGLGLAPSLAVVAPFNLVTLAAMVSSSVLSQTVRQASTPDELLGRVVTSFRMIGFAGIPVGGALAGLVASATSIRTTFVLAGIATVAPVIGIVAAVDRLDPDTDHRARDS